MTDPRSYDDLLRAANPVVEERVPVASESPHAQFLFEKITGTSYHQPGARRLTRWTRTRIWVAALVGTVGVAGGGIAYAVATSQPSRLVSTACYSEASTQADATVVATTSQGALRDCAAAWLAGQIAGQRAQAPPPLIACIVGSGVTGVFPDPRRSPTLCAKLGLRGVEPQPPQPVATVPTAVPTTVPTQLPATSTTVAVPPVVAASNRIVQSLVGTCLDQRQATATVRSALDHVGLTNWNIATNGEFTSARPCASPAFDESQRIVYLVPIPPNPGA